MCVYKYSTEKITKLVLLLEGHPCAQAFTCGNRGHTFLIRYVPTVQFLSD